MVIQTALNTFSAKVTGLVGLLGVLAGILGTFGIAIVLPSTASTTGSAS